MTTWNPRANELFLNARELRAADECREFLDRECGDDVELRAEVIAMLEAENQAGSFLESPIAVSLVPTADEGETAERPGAVIGPYKLLEQIGEGGFGLVFMAEQTQPVRRKVAIKVLKPGMDTRQVVARFEAERQALAIMDHMNIAKVFDGGVTPSGRPYFVMELVRGVPITDYCDRHRLTPRERLELFITVCQAVQHAHQKGIIHRDLKPSNVLITVHDTTPVAKVIDFGVAKALGQALTERTLFTAFTQMVGTPLYMSPEQAGQSGLDVDTRSDIYSLGVLLYEMLTGTTPFNKDRFKQAAYEEIRRIIREEEPPRPSTRLSRSAAPPANLAERWTESARLAKLVRGELDWIVMKCLEKDRSRRYETAAALVADVRRFLNDEPVHACPPSPWYRFRKLARRNRRALATVSVFALAAFIGVGALAGGTVLVWKANEELKKSIERERIATERERREAYYQRITVAHRELSMDNLAAAVRALDQCPEDLRGWEWYFLMRLCKAEPLIIRSDSEFNCVAFSPDGDVIAAACGDGSIRIVNSNNGKEIRRIAAHTQSVVSISFHPRGRYLASASADQFAKVWDLTGGEKVFECTCDAMRRFGSAYTVAFGADGRHLAVGHETVVWVWDWANRQVIHSLSGHDNHSIPVAFSRDGRFLVSGNATREGQKLWDLQDGRLLRTFPAPGHPVSALAFSSDGEYMASASFDRSVKIWNSTTGERIHNLHHATNVDCVSFSPDGRILASSGEDKTVRIWDMLSGREILGIRGHKGRCGCVAFSPDGRRLASASADKTIRIWDATPLRADEGQEFLTFAGHDQEIRSVVWHPKGQIVASAAESSSVKIWNAADGQPVGGGSFKAHSVIVFCLAWHPGGHRIATAGADLPQHTVKVWDASTARELFPIQAGRDHFTGAYHAVTFSPDGRYLVTGKLNGAVQVWDAETGKEIGTLGTHEREIRGVTFSRDGKQLATSSGDGLVKVWDTTRLDRMYLTAKPKPRHELLASVPGPGLNLAFSPDGRRLATGGEDCTVKIWHLQTGKVPQTLSGHKGDVYTVAFSPDGRWVASGGEDSTVKVWDSQTGHLVLNFRGHFGLVNCVAFSPDPKVLLLASGSHDMTVKVWDVSRLESVPDR